MRRRLLTLSIPLVAAAFVAPAVALTDPGVPVAAKKSPVVSTGGQSLHSPKANTDHGRRWN
jgi:hypothetical protein